MAIMFLLYIIILQLQKMETFDNFKIQSGKSNKQTTMVLQVLKEILQLQKENNDIIRRQESMLVEIKEEIRKVRFNTQ